jgi:hypothetical protein
MEAQMADTDTIDVTFLSQKVFHDGTSMVVAKKGDKLPVPHRLIATLVDEGSIKEPKRWREDKEAPAEMSVADGAVPADTSSDDAPAS